jgi:hypothetical protein
MNELVNEGSKMFSVKIMHFLGCLYDYEHLTPERLHKLVMQARERERKQIDIEYPSDVIKDLKELARLLS